MSSPALPANGTRNASDYKGRIKPIWCPGCGNFGLLNSLTKALASMEINPEELSIVSGIGCSSRLPGFVKCYGYHGAHGRALPSAVGVKLGNPRLTVIAIGGDGDGLSIGMGHFPHIARRNLDVTYIMLDNRIYGLTKGQTSPTTRKEYWTKTSPHGVVEEPLNPVELAITFRASFVARAYSGQLPQLKTTIEAAIRHRGFSFLQVISPCVTFAKGSGFDYFNERVADLPDDHDRTDRYAALRMSDDSEKIYAGIFYEKTSDPDYVSQIQAIGGARGRELEAPVPPIDVEGLIERFS